MASLVDRDGPPLRRRWSTRLAIASVATGIVVAASLGLFVGAAGPEVAVDGARPATTFDGVGPGLGPIADGPWQEVTGGWARGPGGARPAPPAPPGGRWTAVVPTGGGDVAVGTTVAGRPVNAGLVFRFRDEDDHWRLVNAQPFGGWALQLVAGGVVTEQRPVPGPAAPGTAVAVHLEGPWIEVWVDGERRLSFHDRTHEDATAVGITASGPDATASRFVDVTLIGRS